MYTLLKPLYEKLGSQQRVCEPSWKIHIRGLTKSVLCRLGFEPCVEEARRIYKKWLNDPEPDKGNP